MKYLPEIDGNGGSDRDRGNMPSRQRNTEAHYTSCKKAIDRKFTRTNLAGSHDAEGLMMFVTVR